MPQQVDAGGEPDAADRGGALFRRRRIRSSVGVVIGSRPKCKRNPLMSLERLRELGHELRRPEADFLRDGIHELRFRFQAVQYRILYFFFEGRAVATHGLTKGEGAGQRN